jgi:glutamate 5-kinase
MPVGTIVSDAETGEVLAELLEHGQKVLLAKGGDGGFGNLHFKTSTNRAPRQKTPGWPGEQKKLALELRVLADVGLLGMPNAGKSTLIAAISMRGRRSPTTRSPPCTPTWAWCGWGPSELRGGRHPGLIEGASEGAGLGHQFLRHLQRTRLLLHVVDLAPFDDEVDPVASRRAHRGRAEEVRPGAARQAALAGAEQAGHGAGGRARGRVKDFVRRLRWKGPVFEISALARQGLRRWSSASTSMCRSTIARRSCPTRASTRRRPRGVHHELRCWSAPGASSSRWAPAWSPTKAAVSTPRPSATGPPAGRAGRQGRELVMVSSGAIAEGMKRLGWATRPKEIHELQAAAAVGQMGLAQMYETKLREQGMGSAQVLLTHADLADRERYLNARSTLLTLLSLGVIPVINENDTVVTDEIKFGDNDTLGALVANLVEADALVILTDQRACMRPIRARTRRPRFIDEAQAGDPQLELMAGGAGSSIGRGGMLTKILAAKRAAGSGASTVIAWGREPDVLLRLAAGEAIGTALLAGTAKLAARKQWMADHLQLRGAVVVDDGAAVKVRDEGKSLLPIGVTEVQGDFERGDVIAVRTAAGREIARGLATIQRPRRASSPAGLGADREPAGLRQRARDDPPRQPGAGLNLAGQFGLRASPIPAARRGCVVGSCMAHARTQVAVVVVHRAAGSAPVRSVPSRRRRA